MLNQLYAFFVNSFDEILATKTLITDIFKTIFVYSLWLFVLSTTKKQKAEYSFTIHNTTVYSLLLLKHRMHLNICLCIFLLSSCTIPS